MGFGEIALLKMSKADFKYTKLGISMIFYSAVPAAYAAFSSESLTFVKLSFICAASASV